MEHDPSPSQSVKDIQASGRHWLEDVLGQHLQENQQVFIMVLSPGREPDEEARRQARGHRQPPSGRRRPTPRSTALPTPRSTPPSRRRWSMFARGRIDARGLDSNVLARATPGKTSAAREVLLLLTQPPHYLVTSAPLLTELAAHSPVPARTRPARPRRRRHPAYLQACRPRAGDVPAAPPPFDAATRPTISSSPRRRRAGRGPLHVGSPPPRPSSQSPVPDPGHPDPEGCRVASGTAGLSRPRQQEQSTPPECPPLGARSPSPRGHQGRAVADPRARPTRGQGLTCPPLRA